MSEVGLGNGVLYAISRAIDAVSGGRMRLVKYYLVAQPIDPAADAPTRAGRFSIDWAGPGSSIFRQIERPERVIAARFAQGARCLAATVEDGALAGFIWFTVGPYVEDEVRVTFVPSPPGETAWDFDVTILPEYRMGRLFAYLWRRASSEMSARGLRATCSRISAFNAASLASHRRLQAAIRGSATFLCIGPFQWMIATVQPRCHVSWRESQRPALTVPA